MGRLPAHLADDLGHEPGVLSAWRLSVNSLSREFRLGRATVERMGRRAVGDKMFEAYLVEHVYDVPEHEPDLGVGKRPDYLLSRDGHTCLCEVKEFAPTTNSIPGSG